MSRSGLTHPCRDLCFSNENVQLLGGNFYGRIFNAIKILPPGRMLAGVLEKSFFVGGIPASTDFSAGFLLRYAAGIFPGKYPAGKMGHLGGTLVGSR